MVIRSRPTLIEFKPRKLIWGKKAFESASFQHKHTRVIEPFSEDQSAQKGVQQNGIVDFWVFLPSELKNIKLNKQTEQDRRSSLHSGHIDVVFLLNKRHIHLRRAAAFDPSRPGGNHAWVTSKIITWNKEAERPTSRRFIGQEAILCKNKDKRSR